MQRVDLIKLCHAIVQNLIEEDKNEPVEQKSVTLQRVRGAPFTPSL